MADKLLVPAALTFDYFAGTELLAALTAGLLSSSSILGRREEQHEVQNAQGNRWAFERQPRQDDRMSRYDEVLSALTTQITRNPGLPRELDPQQVREVTDQIESREELIQLADESLEAQMPVQIVQAIENQGNAELNPVEIVESASLLDAVRNLNQYSLYNLIQFGRANRRTEYNFDDPSTWPPVLQQTANDIFTFLGGSDYAYQMYIVQTQQQSAQVIQRAGAIQGATLSRLVLGASMYNQRFFNMTRLQMTETILELINHINNQEILSIGTYIIQDGDIQQINTFRELLEQLQNTYKQENQSSLAEPADQPDTFIQQPIRSDHFYQTLSLVTFFRDNYRDLVEGAINDAREVHAISEGMSGLELYSAFRSSLIARVTRQFNMSRRDYDGEVIVAERALLSPGAQAIQAALNQYEEEEKMIAGKYEEEKVKSPDISRINDDQETNELSQEDQMLRKQLTYRSRGLNILRSAFKRQPRSIMSNYPVTALQEVLAKSPDSDEISNSSQPDNFSEENLQEIEKIVDVSRGFDSSFNKAISKVKERVNDVRQGNFWRNAFNRRKDQATIDEEERQLIESSELYRTAFNMPEEEIKEELKEFTVELEDETNPYRPRLTRPKQPAQQNIIDQTVEGLPVSVTYSRQGRDEEFFRRLQAGLREGTIDDIRITPPRNVEDRSFRENAASVLLLSVIFGGAGTLTSLIINAINNRRRPPPQPKKPIVPVPPVIIPPTPEKPPEEPPEALPLQQSELIDVIISKPRKIDIRKKRKRKNQEDF